MVLNHKAWSNIPLQIGMVFCVVPVVHSVLFFPFMTRIHACEEAGCVTMHSPLAIADCSHTMVNLSFQMQQLPWTVGYLQYSIA